MVFPEEHIIKAKSFPETKEDGGGHGNGSLYQSES